MQSRAVEIADPVELSVNELIAKGQERGYLTWEEMNDALPDEAILPDRLEAILLRLEELGIDMVDEAEAHKPPLVEEAAGAAKKRFPTEDAVATEEAFPIEAPSRRIDDPVRMYLTQMGEIPLLKRSEEISLAKKIELTRTAFRRRVLESDCILNTVVEIMEQVRDGLLPFDRTMKISTGENQAKPVVMQRLPGNLSTARKLMDLNQVDWAKLQERRLSDSGQLALWRRINQRRRKAVTLLEELALRTSKIIPAMRRLYAL
ncbi:MAG: RNA polymerase sigma factor region1.1 domain-containing protein, partial [Dehalococcoidia bacterium]